MIFTHAVNCTIQARAAARALASIDDSVGTERVGASAASAEANVTGDAECDPVAFLAAAERDLMGLPSPYATRSRYARLRVTYVGPGENWRDGDHGPFRIWAPGAREGPDD